MQVLAQDSQVGQPAIISSSDDDDRIRALTDRLQAGERITMPLGDASRVASMLRQRGEVVIRA